MGGMMDKVNRLIGAGATIPMAIKESLGMSLAEFAAKYDIPLTTASEVINGARRPSEKIVNAFIGEFGGSEHEWRELLWLAGKPESPSAA